MRYPDGHKEATRARIVQIASQKFRSAGREGVSLANVMQEAGLTHGGFYAHFKSKEELFREAFLFAVNEIRQSLQDSTKGQPAQLEALVQFYLSKRHSDNPANGCPVCAVAGEAARYDDQVKQELSQSVALLVELIAEQMPAMDAALRRERALSIFSLLIGALQISRLETNTEASQRVLCSAVDAALVLAGQA